MRFTGTVKDAGACCIKVTVVMPVAIEVIKERSTASSISCDLFKSLISMLKLYPPCQVLQNFILTLLFYFFVLPRNELLRKVPCYALYAFVRPLSVFLSNILYL